MHFLEVEETDTQTARLGPISEESGECGECQKCQKCLERTHRSMTAAAIRGDVISTCKKVT